MPGQLDQLKAPLTWPLLDASHLPLQALSLLQHFSGSACPSAGASSNCYATAVGDMEVHP